VIEPLARRAHELAGQGHSPAARAMGAQALARLAELLLRDAAGELQGVHRLAIVGDGALLLVPFAALPLAAGDDARPLLVDHEVVHLPSLTALRLLREVRQGRQLPPGTLAVVGAPVFRPSDTSPGSPAGNEREEEALEGLGPLPHARQEAEAILALVPASARLGLLGPEALVGRVLRGELARYRILHFPTHALVNAENPNLSGLVLMRRAAGGRLVPSVLWAHQIHHLDLRADLVVLSACRTRLGPELRGEGLTGLPNALFHAGASRLVVTLWGVSDAATAELMTRFYRALLRDRLPPAAALRRAQLSFLRDAQRSPVFYWGGFQLLGDWR
jgi:CHAT domain-containing protein